MSTKPHGRRAPGIWVSLILVVLLVGGAVWKRHLWQFGWGQHSIASSETRAIENLERRHQAQLEFVAARVVDQDGDGAGEFGFLGELTCLQAPRMAGGATSGRTFLD